MNAQSMALVDVSCCPGRFIAPPWFERIYVPRNRFLVQAQTFSGAFAVDCFDPDQDFPCAARYAAEFPQCTIALQRVTLTKSRVKALEDRAAYHGTRFARCNRLGT